MILLSNPEIAYRSTRVFSAGGGEYVTRYCTVYPKVGEYFHATMIHRTYLGSSNSTKANGGPLRFFKSTKITLPNL